MSVMDKWYHRKLIYLDKIKKFKFHPKFCLLDYDNSKLKWHVEINGIKYKKLICITEGFLREAFNLGYPK